jgi:hypothetical protein
LSSLRNDVCSDTVGELLAQISRIFPNDVTQMPGVKGEFPSFALFAAAYDFATKPRGESNFVVNAVPLTSEIRHQEMRSPDLRKNTIDHRLVLSDPLFDDKP